MTATAYTSPKMHQLTQDENPTSSSPSDSQVDIFIDRQIGSGTFMVYHAYLPFQKTEYALKLFPRNKLAEASYEREKEIISRLRHKYIIKPASRIHLRDLKEFDSNYILMEYAPYGNFYDLVINKGLVDDKLIRTYFHQLIAGVEYLHSKNIAHMDLKLENLLLGEDFNMRIIDFDQSHHNIEEKFEGKGTPCYRSPQVLEGRCEEFFPADVYSLGILLYICKAREFPFVEYREGGRTKLLHYDLFSNNNEEFWRVKVSDRKNTDFFSQDFKELVNGMLESDPMKRFGLSDIKRSRWYNGPVFEDEELKPKMEKMWERITFKKSLRKSSGDSNS